MPFKQMENITAFIQACRNVFRVPEHELFEEKDLESFVTCVCSLGRVVSADSPPWLQGTSHRQRALAWPNYIAARQVLRYSVTSSSTLDPTCSAAAMPASAPVPAAFKSQNSNKRTAFTPKSPPNSLHDAFAPQASSHVSLRCVTPPRHLFVGKLGKSKGANMVAMLVTKNGTSL